MLLSSCLRHSHASPYWYIGYFIYYYFFFWFPFPAGELFLEMNSPLSKLTINSSTPFLNDVWPYLVRILVEETLHPLRCRSKLNSSLLLIRLSRFYFPQNWLSYRFWWGQNIVNKKILMAHFISFSRLRCCHCVLSNLILGLKKQILFLVLPSDCFTRFLTSSYPL